MRNFMHILVATVRMTGMLTFGTVLFLTLVPVHTLFPDGGTNAAAHSKAAPPCGEVTPSSSTSTEISAQKEIAAIQWDMLRRPVAKTSDLPPSYDDNRWKWKPFHPSGILQKEGSSEELWLRGTFLSDPPGSSYLFLSFLFVHADLYSGTTHIFSTQERSLGGYPHLLTPLPEITKRNLFYIKITSPYPRIALFLPPLVGTEGAILRTVLQKELSGLFLSFFALSVGIVSLFVSFLRFQRGNTVHIWFGLFSISSAIWLLSATQTIFIFFPQSNLPLLLLNTAAWHAAMTALLLFFRKFMGNGPLHIIPLLSSMEALLALLHPVLLYIYIKYTYYIAMYYDLERVTPGLTFSLAFSVLILSLKNSLHGRSQEIRWIAVGFAVLTATGIAETMFSMSNAGQMRYYFWGLLLFMFLIAFVQERSFATLEISLADHSARLAERETELLKERIRLEQSRMNPHFLLNSLSMFYALLEKKRLDAARTALLWLSDHYRYLTDRSFSAMVPVSQELEFCENYLKIQSLRFEGHMKYEIHTEEISDVQDLSIPPLTIQPLIENAIQHGIRHISGVGWISLYAKRLGDGIAVEIIDNGRGLQENMDSSRSLANIKNRLLYYYEHVDLRVQERHGESGAITILQFHGKR